MKPKRCIPWCIKQLSSPPPQLCFYRIPNLYRFASTIPDTIPQGITTHVYSIMNEFRSRMFMVVHQLKKGDAMQPPIVQPPYLVLRALPPPTPMSILLSSSLNGSLLQSS